MAEKKNLYQRHVDWIENHRFWGRLLIVGIYLGIAGGILGFGEKAFDFVKWIKKKDSDAIEIMIQAHNTSSNLVSFDSICEVEMIEEFRGGMSFYGGGKIRLVPLNESSTNNFRLREGEIREYFIRVPNNQENRDILERQAATIKIKMWRDDGIVYKAELPFSKESIAKEKALVKFSNENP